MPGSWVLGNAQRDTTTTNIELGLVFKNVGAAGVYRCPSDRSTVLKLPGVPRTRSYSINNWLNGDGDATDAWPFPESPTTDPLDKTKFSQLIDPPPVRIFVFIDEHEQSIFGGFFVVGNPMNFVPDVWYQLPADRHSLGCNLTFADGHLEHWRWKWPKKFRPPHGQPVASPSLDPQRYDLQDLHRLQACVPHNE
jgi:prepilin-type processing-associated H-X9-DG protein